MKFTSSLLSLLFFVLIVNAQTENTLPVDERGKLIYYEVVTVKTAADSLGMRALAFIKKQKELKYKKTSGDTGFVATGKLIINKTLLVMSHPSGEVAYHFQVEVKDGKYRFWLTDFVFNPYVRDRYGNFVKGVSAGIPLEFNPKLIKSEWKEYLAQTTKYAKDFSVKFKNYMTSKTPITVVPVEKKVVKKEW